MALTSQEQLELEALRSSADTLPPSRQARLAQLESKETIGGSPEGSAKVAELSPTIGMLTADKPQSFTPTGAFMQAELEKKPKEQVSQAAGVTPPSATEAATPKVKEPDDIAGAMNALAKKMANIPEEMRVKFDEPMSGINRALSDLNTQYQADQASAKDATEKKKNRAEWASIASMLAKNIVGYAAALHGVDPNAMAYQTTDWEKRIQGLNDELNMNLGNLRDSMKMKVEQKLGEKKDIQDQMGETFKSKMEALRTQGEGSMAKYKGQLQASEAEKDRQAREQEKQLAKDTVTTKLEAPGKELGAALGAASNKKTFEQGIGQLKTMASQYQINPAEIDSILKKYDTGFLGMGKGNEMTPEAQNEIAGLFENKYRQLTTTRSAVPSGGNAPSGQPPAPVVQSGTVPMFKDGKQYNIPADKVEAAKNKGYTLQ